MLLVILSSFFFFKSRNFAPAKYSFNGFSIVKYGISINCLIFLMASTEKKIKYIFKHNTKEKA